MSEQLKLFLIDDGEHHWIAAFTAESARKWATESYEIDVKSVEEVPDDARLIISFDDEPDLDDMPSTPFQDEHERWYCSALVKEWLAKASDGDLVCSTVY